MTTKRKPHLGGGPATPRKRTGGPRRPAYIEALGTTPWRVGRKVKRTVYDMRGRLVGLMDTPDIAAMACEAVNAFFGELVEPNSEPPRVAAMARTRDGRFCGACRRWIDTCDIDESTDCIGRAARACLREQGKGRGC